MDYDSSRLIAKTPWAPPVLIAVTSVLTYLLGAYSLSQGWYTIFQNLLYIPIILACVFYITRGFIFSVILSGVYFLEIVLFSSDPLVLEGALVRVLIFIFVAAVVTHLTRLKCRSDHALRKSEELLSLAIRGSGEGLWDLDIPNGVIVINESGAGLLGYTSRELNPLTIERWQSLANPDDIAVFMERLNQYLTHTIPEFEAELRMRHPQGYWVWLLIRGMVTDRDPSGNPTRMTGTYLDISRRKSLEIELEGQKQELENRVQERTKELSDTVARLKEEISERTRIQDELATSEEKYRTLFQSMATGVFYQMADGSIVDANPAALRILGLTYEQFTGRDSYDPGWKVVTEDGSEVPPGQHPSLIALKTGKAVKDTTYGIVNPSLQEFTWVIVNAEPQFRPGELDPYRVYVTMNDITSRKLAEDRLRIRDMAITTSIDAIAISDLEGILTFVNPSFLRMWGYPREEVVLGKPAVNFWETREKAEEVIRVLMESGGWEGELVAKRMENTVFYIQASSSLVKDEHGKPICLMGIFRDITEKKQADETIALANQKLTLMNDITYQDIQNKVTALRGYLDLSRFAKTEAEHTELHKKQDEVLKAIHNLISKTKDYQKMGVETRTWIDLETLISRIPMPSGTNAVRKLNLHGLSLYSDPLISRVFENLITNAVSHGKTLNTIEICYEETPEGIKIIVEDDGVGIPLQEKTQIFNRVTAGKGKFGLFFVQQFLNLSGMEITENGEAGKGARFEITVPDGMYRIEP